MYRVEEDNSIHVTRGDIVVLSLSADKNGTPYTFQVGEVLRIKVYGKKDAESVVLQKDFPITETAQTVTLFLGEEDTKIGEVISKPRDYWYEVELNPFDNPQTIIGYNEDGPALFRIYPEGADIPEQEVDPEVIKVIDTELDMNSTRPVQNQVIARAFANLQAGYQATHDAVANLHVTPQMFGAIGDGVADDTSALQMAIDAINEQYIADSGATKTGMYSVLRLPAGVYVVKRQINLREIHTIDFTGAVIVSECEDFAFKSSAYKARYIGGVFIGKKIFTFNNKNNDQGNIIVEKAEFKDCDVAIDVTCQSSQFIVQECTFDSCMHPVVQNACDGMTIEKNWATCPTPQDNDSNFKFLGGKTTFKNNLLVPILGEYDGTETAWIEYNQNILICTDNRFGGENSGRTPINLKSKFSRDNLVVLRFEHNLVSNHRDEQSCIRLFTLPNTLIVKNNYYGVLLHYVLSVTSVETEAFNADLAEAYALYNSADTEENPFGYPKFRRFQYEVDNNFMQGRTSTDNAMESQRENEYWFLLKNYSKIGDLNKEKCVFAPGTTYQTQQIENSGTETVAYFKLPIFVSSGLEVEVSFNSNYKGSNYSIKKSYKVFPTKYYDSAIVTKFAVVDMNKDAYPDSINSTVSIGLYNDSGEYYGADANGVTGRLVVKITGIAVKCDRITCKPMF